MNVLLQKYVALYGSNVGVSICCRVGLMAVLLVMFGSAAISRAQSGQRQLFDGGMMVHAGRVGGTVGEPSYTLSGLTTGMGGVLRWHVGDYLRVGGEGYVSTLSLWGNGSFVRVGCGGLVADGGWSAGRWRFYGGLTLGGGSASTLLLIDGSADDWQAEREALLHNEPFMYLSPNIGMEYALTAAIRLTLRVDRMVPFRQSVLPTGARFQLGFVFAH